MPMAIFLLARSGRFLTSRFYQFLNNLYQQRRIMKKIKIFWRLLKETFAEWQFNRVGDAI